ncbi:lysis system i-spanin subunit Rz [Dickeya chrysanthemi]|uniref:lysis system i-spanin subunit Rz n=1 Tax=Dickeya chrysanthemi TaxID=556 RepID=UPI0008FBED6A|nr:lysis system i-spanin subunit Rz [Dickeya chrysanthemi]
MPDWKITGVALAVGAIAGAAFCWWIVSTGYDADIARLNAQHAETLKAISDRATADSEAARLRERSFSSQIAELDRKSQERFSNAQRENDRLRDDVSAGKRRVRIATAALSTCQQSAGGIPGAGCVGDGAGAELTAEAGRIVLDIRAGVVRREEKIEYL